MAQRIREIVCELDELDRLVLWSYVVDGRSKLAIAQDLGLNWHRIDKLLDRAFARIRQRMEE